MARVIVLCAALTWTATGLATDFIFPIQQVRTISAGVADPNSTGPVVLSRPGAGPWYEVLSMDAPV